MMKRIFGAVLALALAASFFTLFTFDAHAASDMRASNACVEMIKDTEGFRAIPYWDYSQWTVGFGTTCPADRLDEYKQYGIPVEDANALLYEQLATFEKAVNKFADKYGLTLTQNQFDALVSFTYNLGGSMLGKESNTIVKAILSGATGNDLIYAFSVYCMAGGEFLPGLMRRRMAEANLFMNGVYSEYAPASYCYVLYNANGGVRDSSAQGYDANMPATPMSRPTRDGYTFVGWYTAPEGGIKITSLDETTHGMTLYAHWQISETEAEEPTDPTTGINVIVVSAAVNVRCGPGVGYGIVTNVFASDRLTIIGTTEVDGVLWGQFSEGWICLEHTNYFEIVAPDTEEEEIRTWQVPILATVVDANGIIVYNGPHTTYPQLKTLQRDTQIMLHEIMLFAGSEWARCDAGWVQLNSKLVIHDENKLAHNFTATTTVQVIVRSGPGVSNDKVTTLSKGTSHTVYAIVVVDNAAWGRVSKGWIHLENTDFDAGKLDYYQNHAYADWYVVTEATCVTPGQERHNCQHCDYYELRDTQLGDHSYGEWYTVEEASCVSDGMEQRDCLYCDEHQTREIGKTGHEMSDWATILEPTCTQPGTEQRTCPICGLQETREVALLGHSFGAWYETKAPTAEENGEERRDCQNCEHYETRTTVLSEHNFGQWYVVTEPTCTENGQERRDCQDCDHYQVRELEATGHSIGQWYVGQAPTCTEVGQERRDCAHCDYFESRELEATGHSVGQWYVSQEPTCTELGQERRDCEHCDYNEVRELDALGHSFGDWYETIAPTISDYGQERRDCAHCDAYETRDTDKLPEITITRIYATVTCSSLRIRSGPGTGYTAVGILPHGAVVEILEIRTVGTDEWGRTEKGWICLTGLTKLHYVEEVHSAHTYGDWTTQKEATCTETGLLRRDCTGCSHYETQTIPVTDHNFGEWYSVKEATATDYGEERRDCTGCSHYETRQTDKLTVITKLYATITCAKLSIREGAGTGYTRLGFYNEGEVVEILEQTQVGDMTWGRTEKGWICLTDYTTLEEVEEPVNHIHSYGDWYVTKEATTSDYGEERRDCACGHYETRQTEKLVTRTYATITCAKLSIREGAGTGFTRLGFYDRGDVVEILEQVQVGNMTWGRTEKGWICLTGYTILKTVTEKP